MREERGESSLCSKANLKRCCMCRCHFIGESAGRTPRDERGERRTARPSTSWFVDVRSRKPDLYRYNKKKSQKTHVSLPSLPLFSIGSKLALHPLEALARLLLARLLTLHDAGVAREIPRRLNVVTQAQKQQGFEFEALLSLFKHQFFCLKPGGGGAFNPGSACTTTAPAPP